jgi:Protein of unknown function (DUF2778)
MTEPSWVYEITTGRLFRPDGTLAGTGYAGGNLGQDPEAVNNPADSYIKDVGPLPSGWYTFGSAHNSPTLGPVAIPLEPDTDNVMFGRSGFYCHGDLAEKYQSASEGCIVMANPIRMEMEASPVRRLQVVAVLRGV